MDTAFAVFKIGTELSYISIAGACFTLWVAYLAGLAIYRLYFSPLAKFSGPKLAALSKYYEFYYEVVKRGQFTFQIQKMHKEYGPIVRITPFEVHVQDSSFWNTLYVRPKADKYAWMNGRFGNDASTFTTSDHALHRIRRGALNPMFSKRAVGEFEPFVRQRVDEICRRIATYMDDDRVLPMHKVWNAMAGDVVTQYSFGFSYNHIESDDFKESFHDAFMAVSEFGHLTLQFPWITPLVNMLPDDWNQAMNPPLTKLLQLQRDLRKIIFRINQDHGKAEKKPEQRTIFHEILQSDLPDSERSMQRLGDEAQLVIGAGLTTTAWALSNAMFYIVNNPQIQETLRAELREAFPNLNAPDALSYQQLEKLPYLRACIREGIRLSHGVSARNPRIVDVPIVYDQWTIPPGTPVSMTIGDVHFDEAIFPKPKEFLPERWLNNPRTPDGNSLDHYFVAFGKGPRLCLGINLAYMELFIALGAVFRCFSLEIYETDSSDVQLAHDFFLPSPKLNSTGVRVKVVEVDPGFGKI